MNSRRILIVLVITVSAIAVISALYAYNLSLKAANQEPVPEITILYQDKPSNGALQYYSWNGRSPAPHTRFDLPENIIPVEGNQYVEFTTNSVRQPDYYLVTVAHITQDTSNETEPIIMNERLPGNSLQANFEAGRNYALSVTGIWVEVTLYGQSEDSVTYAFVIGVE